MPMEITKNNYLYGTGHGDTWHVNVDPPTKKVKTYFEETLDAVEYVYANKTGKFQVLYSGGLDSQYVCEVLLHLKMPFDPIIIELTDNDGNVLNQHDIVYAYEFCKSKNIEPVIYKLNFYDFVESGRNVEIAESVTCCSFALPATMHVASQLDGFTLLGNDPPYMRYEKDIDIWVLEELEYIHSLQRYYKKYNVNGCPFLLSYTPEMMLSFLLDPNIVKLGTGQLPGKTGSNSTKSHVFNNGSNFGMPVYDFVTQKRIKFTGYEQIYHSDIMDHPNMKIFDEFKKKWNGEYLEPYTDAVKRLSINQ
jgi:hypothetical protein